MIGKLWLFVASKSEYRYSTLINPWSIWLILLDNPFCLIGSLEVEKAKRLKEREQI
jgi:hypothetical protein